jgi:hypothetical protein
MQVFYEFPSEAEWEALISQFPRNRLTLRHEQFLPLRNDPVAGLTLLDVLCHWETRKFALQLAYGMVLFYFQKGIPDDNWVDSSGDSGATFEYFPAFTERDHFTKQQFDYHVEAFFLKIFSCWDAVGHILNILCDLEIKQEDVTFDATVNALEPKDMSVFKLFDSVRKDECGSFKKAKKIRRGYVHNYIPTTIGPSIRRVPGSGKTYEGHAGEYTTSKEIMSIAQGSLDLLAQTVEYVRLSYSSDPLRF